jgi:hypothetical protein
MPRFFLHIHNENGLTRDEEGMDASDQAAACAVARDSIRSIVSAEAREGLIDLGGRIEIEDDIGNLLTEIIFIDAFDVKIAARRS